MAIGGSGERIGEGYVEARLDTSRLNRDADKMQRTLQQKFQQTGQKMQQTGRTLTRRATLPILAMGTAIVKTAADFESSMNRVAALTDATGDDFDRLNDRAQELGRTTQFSASEAADGMAFLAQAGFEVTEIYEAMPGVLNLAASGQLELAEAADIASNIMSGMNLKVEDLDHIIDVMAATTTNANTDMRQLGDAMVYVAPIAAGAGVELEEVAAAIGLMGDAGIQSSMAGTSLRMAISQMINPSGRAASAIERLGINTKDAEGNMLPLHDILRQLEDAGATTGDMMDMFGQRAGPAMAALLARGSDALQDFTGELEESGGTAERIADRQMEGLNGSLQRMRSAMEGAAIAVGESGLVDMLADLAEGAAGLFQSLAETNPELLNAAVIAAALVAAIGPATWMIGGMVRGFGRLLTPAGMAAIGIAGVTAAVLEFNASLKDARAEAEEAGRTTEEQFGTLWDTLSEGPEFSAGMLLGPIGMWDQVTDMISEAVVGLEMLFGVGQDASDAGGDIGDAIGGVGAAARDAKPDVDDLSGAVADGDISMEEALAVAGELGVGIEELGGDFEETAEEVKTATEALAEYEEQQRAIADPVFNAQRALNALDDAQSAVNKLVEDGKVGTEEYKDALVDEWQAADDAEFALRRLSAAHDDGTTSLEQIKARADELVSSMGLSGEAADAARDMFMELFGAAEQLPEVKSIEVNVTGNAVGAIGAIKGQLDRLPRRVTTQVTASGPTIQHRAQVMHEGGWVTGNRREIPALLERGEFVLSNAMLDGHAPVPPDLSGLLGGDGASAPAGRAAAAAPLGGGMTEVNQYFQSEPSATDLFRARDAVRHMADEVA